MCADRFGKAEIVLARHEVALRELPMPVKIGAVELHRAPRVVL